MPFLASGLQNHYFNQQMDTLPLKTAQLVLKQENSALRALSLLSSSYSTMELQQGSTLTKEEACSAARDTLSRISVDYGIFPNLELTGAPISHVFLATSDNGTDTAVLWEFLWQTNEYSCLITLDDTSGKLVGFDITNYNVYYEVSDSKDSTILPKDGEAFEGKITDFWTSFADSWTSFCSTYYDIPTVTPIRSASDKGEMFSMKFSDDDGFSFEIPLFINTYNIQFNY